MSAPTYPPPPYPPETLPAPVITAEQAVERERVYFLSWHERPGWYLDLEASIVGPHVMNRLYQKINLSDGGRDYLHLPSADLGGTIAPRLELGYRFGENLGALLVSYRFLTSKGIINYYDGSNGMPTGRLESRLDMQTLDLDYATRDIQLGRTWELRGRIGARVGYAYFDSNDQEVYFPYDPADPLLFNSIKTSNRFAGAGPHALLELEHRLRSPALSVFSRVEGSLLIGQVEQEFEESLAQGSAFAYGAASPRSTQSVPVLQTQFGLRWRPTWHDNWNFAVGYTYEQWWSVGNAGGSTAQIWSQGCFLRGEVMF
jgi:hypothetical protein